MKKICLVMKNSPISLLPYDEKHTDLDNITSHVRISGKPVGPPNCNKRSFKVP